MESSFVDGYICALKEQEFAKNDPTLTLCKRIEQKKIFTNLVGIHFLQKKDGRLTVSFGVEDANTKRSVMSNVGIM